MGVLNVTPDSFSDGGQFLDPVAALERLAQMSDDGAAIVDVGAESTRPGSEPVPAEEQLARLEPVFAAMRAQPSAVAISIDTTSAVVAKAAIEAGAVLVNDVTAGRADPDLLGVAADGGAALCVVHMLGEPRTMQDAPSYRDVVDEVRAFLETRIAAAVAAGVREDRILIDPGIGFGKRLEDNLRLLRELPALAELGRPIVVGVSRKSMFAQLLGRPVDERMAGSVAAGLMAIDAGASVLRVHDVRETVDAIGVWRAIRGDG